METIKMSITIYLLVCLIIAGIFMGFMLTTGMSDRDRVCRNMTIVEYVIPISPIACFLSTVVKE